MLAAKPMQACEEVQCAWSVTAIVVTYNSAHCVASFAPLQHLVNTLIVVDNGSEDDTVARVAALAPAATWLPLGRNLGFGAANNRGSALSSH